MRFAVLGTSAREAAKSPAPADRLGEASARPRPRSPTNIVPVAVRILVLTTSYPRDAATSPGRSWRAVVLCATPGRSGVVSPATFRHYGIAYGDGIVNNLRPRRGRCSRCRCSSLSFARAARRAARDADVVHAHWLPTVLAGLATREASRAPALGHGRRARHACPARRRSSRRGAVVVCASTALAAERAALGAREVRVIPRGVDAGDRRASPRARPTSSTSVASPRRRACASSLRPRVAFRSSSSVTARSVRAPQAVGFVPRELGALLRAGVDRRRAVAA